MIIISCFFQSSFTDNNQFYRKITRNNFRSAFYYLNHLIRLPSDQLASFSFKSTLKTRFSLPSRWCYKRVSHSVDRNSEYELNFIFRKRDKITIYNYLQPCNVTISEASSVLGSAKCFFYHSRDSTIYFSARFGNVDIAYKIKVLHSTGHFQSSSSYNLSVNFVDMFFSFSHPEQSRLFYSFFAFLRRNGIESMPFHSWLASVWSAYISMLFMIHTHG